jgi:hypothetical protein
LRRQQIERANRHLHD